MLFYILMTALGIFFAILQRTWLFDFPTQALHIDFLIVAIAAISFLYEWKRALPLVITYGIVTDIATAAPFGMSVFSYIIIYGFIRTVIAKISFQVGLGLFFWVAFISFLDKAICSFVILVANGNALVSRIMLERAPIQAALDGLFGLAFVPFMFWLAGLSWEKLTKPKGLVLK